MPVNNSTSQKTRTAYHEQQYAEYIEDDDRRAERADKMVASEDELIWAWSRDPETDLTQIEARDRAQSHDYGRFNISQSSLSRKLSKMDETMLTGGVIKLGGKEFVPPDMYDGVLNDNPKYLDAMRELLAKFICDKHALDQFDNPGERTPQWAQDRFPDMDPNLGREKAMRWASRTGDSIENLCGGLHEPHE